MVRFQRNINDTFLHGDIKDTTRHNVPCVMRVLISLLTLHKPDHVFE